MSKRMTGLVAVVLLMALAALAAQQLSVQVRETRLRDKPSYLGAAASAVTYGDRVEVLEERGPWRRVRTGDGRTGWLHESALTERKLALSSGDRDAQAAADQSELALAGKGFGPEVEDAYRKKHAGVDFAWVDTMATWRVTPEQSAAFLAAGRVGGAR
jgi:uncharacterized protein YgiM (DUF1202 family)